MFPAGFTSILVQLISMDSLGCPRGIWILVENLRWHASESAQVPWLSTPHTTGARGRGWETRAAWGLGLAYHAQLICLLASGWMPAGPAICTSGNLRTGKILSSEGIHHSSVMDLQSEAGFGNCVLETERWKSILDNLVFWMYYFSWRSLWLVFFVRAALFHTLMQLLLTQSKMCACAQRVCVCECASFKSEGKETFPSESSQNTLQYGWLCNKKKKDSHGPFREAAHWALCLELFGVPVWC